MTDRISVKDGLQLDDDHKFERADWRAQRIGWSIMALLLALALAGAMGRGVLSDDQLPLGTADTLVLESVTRRWSMSRCS